MSVEYFFGVHLGRVNEPGIICSVSRETGDKRPIYSLNRHLNGQLTNDPLETVREIKYVMNRYNSDSKYLVVDMTNVGMPFIDLCKEQGLSPLAISTTKDDFVEPRGEILLVPRRDLLMNLLIMKHRLNVTFPTWNPEFVNQLPEKLPQMMVRALYTEESKARSDPEGSTDYIYYGFAAALWCAEKGMSGDPKTQ